MKFVYCDESGSLGEDPVFVMAGILIDGYRLRKQNKIINARIEELLDLYPGLKPKELKTKKMLNGSDKWGQVDPALRKKFVNDLCDLVATSAKVVIIPIDSNKFAYSKPEFMFCRSNHWIAAGIYIACVAEVYAQKINNANKATTIIIMDDNKRDQTNLSDILYSPPAQLADLTGEKPTNILGNILDTAIAIKSDHSGLVQAADCVAYVSRRHEELQGESKINYEGEKEFIDSQFTKLDKKRLKLPASRKSGLAKVYQDIATISWRI